MTDASSAKFGMKRAGNSSAPMLGARTARRAVALVAERHEVVAPRDELAARVDAALEVVEARRTIEVVLHVVFARPQQLHGNAGLLRDPRRLDHVVVVQPPAEAAAAARAYGS